MQQQRQQQQQQHALFLSFFTLLLQTLIGHSIGWVNKFTTLLLSLCNRELVDIHETIRNSIKAISKPVANLDQLGDAVRLLQELKRQMQSIEERFQPLEEKFLTLEKFEVRNKDDICITHPSEHSV